MNFMGKIGGSEENKQQPPFLSPPASHHDRDAWLLDRHSQVGESSSNHEKQEEGGGMMVEREHLFDKVVTPSDVGKLNRLVIPKQHAERYFPLDSSTNDKGLLLNFEDMNGKLWRFRYSYWNSSQSYVMTKGWSRFVKDKKLDAGDIVSFQRGVGVTAKDRLFIDWRRRIPPSPQHQLSSSSNLSFPFHNHNFIYPWNPLVLQSLPARRNPNLMLQLPNNPDSSRSVYFGSGGFGVPQQQVQMIQRSGFGFGFDPPQPPLVSPAPVHGKASSKRLRLFGVNMDCAFTEHEDDQDYDHPSFSTKDPLTPSPSSSSFSKIPYRQLSPYGGELECNQSTSSSAHAFSIVTKSTDSNMSLDLEM